VVRQTKDAPTPDGDREEDTVTIVPELDVEIFADESLDNPWAGYRAIRDAGPVVRLEHELYDVYAIGRFEDVRNALRDWQSFSSAEGIGFNDLGNEATQGTVVGCDPPLHDQLRAIMMDRLRLSEVREMTGIVQVQADALVARLLEQGSFDAVKDLAEGLVPAVVGDLLGVEGEMLERFATSGSATFTVMGPPNQRLDDAFPDLLELLQLIGGLTKDDMVPGGMGWNLYDAAERGEIPEDMCTTLLWNYVGPGFETSINAIGSAVWMLARDPEQWKALKSDTSLVASAGNEAMRMETPIQIWGRHCYQDVELHDTVIPGGSRVAVLLGSANRDERKYPEPDHFNVRRNPVDHIAFGHGIHTCLGASLARAQLAAVLTAIAEQVTTLECGEPVRRLNNTTRGLSSLPVSVS
jgi:cytochrome P450